MYHLAARPKVSTWRWRPAGLQSKGKQQKNTAADFLAGQWTRNSDKTGAHAGASYDRYRHLS